MGSPSSSPARPEPADARLGVVTDAAGVPLGSGLNTVKAFFGPSTELGFDVPDDPILLPSTTPLGSQLTLRAQRGIVFASARTENGDIYVAAQPGPRG